MIQGRWDYYSPGDFFVVVLDSRDRVTGLLRRFTVYGETPEWGNWKLERRREDR